MTVLPHVCGVCGGVLGRLTTVTDGVETSCWQHAVPTDHEAVPVPRTETDTEKFTYRCDFCLHDVPVEDGWVYATSPYVFAGETEQSTKVVDDDGAGWIACPRCRRLIDADRREDLVARCTHMTQPFHPQMPVEQAHMVMATGLEAFFTARTGDGFPLREYRE